jgi:Uma2 family endonuclease
MAVQDKTQKLTTADFLAFCDLPENADRILELIDGEIGEKMPSFTPSRLAVRIATYLNIYLMKNEIGSVTGPDGGYLMPDGSVLIPDVGYISKARLSETPTREVPTFPDLAVKVKSPTDTLRKMRLKAEKYIANGTRIVWLVFPEEQAVEVYVADQDVKTLKIDESLSGGDVLPNFALAVKDIFAGM